MIDNIKLLTFSGLFPTKQNISSGTFLINRLIQLHRKGIDILPVKLSNLLYSHRILKNYSLKFNNLKLNFEPLNYCKFRYKGNFEMATDELYKLYSGYNKNIIHIHFGFPEGYIGYILKMKYGIGYILTVHGSDIHTIPFKNIHYREMVLKALNNANHVIFVSNNLLEIAQKIGFKNKRFSVISGGVDTNLFKIKNKKYKNKKTIGFIGNLERIKGAHLLPEIFLEINKLNKKINFVIIGDGHLKSEIQNKLKTLHLFDKVDFKGRLPHSDLPDELSKIDILVLPSLNEGFPSVVLESLSSGIPVIASKVGGLAEIIDSGKNGVLVPYDLNFIHRFSKEIIIAMDKKWNKKELRASIIKYDWEYVVRQEIYIYMEILNI